jgi:hypothetical protein
MSRMSRTLSLATCLAATVSVAGAGRPLVAADWQRAYLEPAVQAWMGVVTLLAEDGERETSEQRPQGEDRNTGRWKGRGDGPRGDALGMLNDILGRLSRIEAILADRGPMTGRGPGGDGRGAWRGPGRPELSPEMRAQMEARMKEGREKMRAARKKWEQASSEEREEMKQQWEARMQEGREKMRAAREKWEQASPEEREAMKKQMEGRRQEAREKMEKARAEKGERPRDGDEMRKAMERVREEGRKRMEEAKTKMEEARKRFQEMEQRVKRLEAEVGRLQKAAEKED